MSTLLGKRSSDGTPLLHMTSDVRTKSELDGEAFSSTIFHSDLPYVFSREQFTLDSYTTWAGGRKFALSSELLSFRSANPDLAYFLIIEDESGSKLLHDPVMHVCGRHYVYASGTQNPVMAINGAQYQVAYTSSNTQLENITKNSISPSIALTFRPWQSGDTHVTVFKTPVRYPGPGTPGYTYWSNLFMDDLPGGWSGTPLQYLFGDLGSVGQDVSKLHFVFLNIVHTATTLERQKDFTYDHIKIAPDEFLVNGVDLDKMTPIISHGQKTAAETVSNYISGSMIVPGKKPGMNMDAGKISSAGVLSSDSPVIEIPPYQGGGLSWHIDFANQIIKRDGVVILNSDWIGRALYVTGSKELTFSQSIDVYMGEDYNDVSSTQTGDIGDLTADTVFLASVVSGGTKLHSVSLFGIGDNVVSFSVVGYGVYQSYQITAYIYFYVNIDVDGAISVHSYSRAVYGFGASGFTWEMPDLTVRLIGLRSI